MEMDKGEIMKKEQILFTLTKEHLELMRNMYWDWNLAEFGAPTVDPKRPYGNSDVLDDMAKILNKKVVYDKEGMMQEELEEELERVHQETQTALQIVLTLRTFKPGVYKKQDEYDDQSWILVKETK
jgi:hypothetical protein